MKHERVILSLLPESDPLTGKTWTSSQDAPPRCGAAPPSCPWSSARSQRRRSLSLKTVPGTDWGSHASCLWADRKTMETSRRSALFFGRKRQHFCNICFFTFKFRWQYIDIGFYWQQWKGSCLNNEWHAHTSTYLDKDQLSAAVDAWYCSTGAFL